MDEPPLVKGRDADARRRSESIANVAIPNDMRWALRARNDTIDSMTAAVVWGVFGLLAATLGLLASAVFATFHRLDGRFDGLHEDLREVRGDLRDLREAVLTLDRRLTTAGG